MNFINFINFLKDPKIANIFSVIGFIVFFVLFVYTHMMIGKYGGRLRDEIGFSKSDDYNIYMVRKFGNKFYYGNTGGPQVTDTDKAVKLLEEIEDELKLYFGLYITFSIIFFGFFVLTFFYSLYSLFKDKDKKDYGNYNVDGKLVPFNSSKKNNKDDFKVTRQIFLAGIVFTMPSIIVFSILFMININKGMNDIPNFIDNEIKKNNKNTSS